MKLTDLNKQRRSSYRKDMTVENFLGKLNDHLTSFEHTNYQACKIDHPLIFTFGVPRSGTTIITQVIARCFDTGFINNFTARFWKAPLTGLRLAKILGVSNVSSFSSDYGGTSGLGDIHDFGYFWRYWLKKDDWLGVKNAESIEETIDWKGLYNVLSNIQDHFGKALVFKNIFGAYHLERMSRELDQKVFYIYIRRDPLENACSIMAARKKFYNDSAIWWSTMPLEYERLKTCDPWEQVAGQVYFLDKYYLGMIEQLKQESYPVMVINYEDLVEDSEKVMEMIKAGISSDLHHDLEKIAKAPTLKTKLYTDDLDKQQLRRAFKKWEVD